MQQAQQAQKDAEEQERQRLRAQGWVDANKGEVARLEGLEVRVVSANIGQPNLVQEGRPYNAGNRFLIIHLAVKNTSERLRRYDGWADRATLNEDKESLNWTVNRSTFANGVEVVGQKKATTIQPGQTLTDVLVFEQPQKVGGNEPKYLKLELPGRHVGIENLNARFIIPYTWVSGR